MLYPLMLSRPYDTIDAKEDPTIYVSYDPSARLLSVPLRLYSTHYDWLSSPLAFLLGEIWALYQDGYLGRKQLLHAVGDVLTAYYPL